MADKDKGSSAIEAALSVFNTLWEWTATSEPWRQGVAVAAISVVLLLALAACFSAFGKVLDGIIKITDALKSSGLPRFMKRENRLRIRRRSQFCSVLEADLTNIAKAESWNDQYFTDLEAEVESEGGYYISPLHRVLGRESRGLRKEKSLINAITSSTERAIQLTGEPGSGKSVALRHLGSQLARRARKCKSIDVLVPLYINLREITIPSGTPITADAIKNFILDNIRRGDSDTTAYVRENWSDYQERGVWFFLFDSFDEIPAVLHAEKGSLAIKEYAEAIRKFLEGMGECKGILASREFKGPESLPWIKFRILRLTPKKQRELVNNAFLSPSQERTVLHHISARESAVATTPLFLTLLCRYVKEYSSAPKNDYELLSLQIDRLAHRDPAYLFRTYGLTPSELLAGAQRISRLFAEELTLGLAPTIDQVEGLLPRHEIPGNDVERFVAAMVDAKIARADVQNAAPGDRRFAFAHRRYQEALFVRHLVINPEYLHAKELLTDPRWREYAVTLLETQSAEALQEMFMAATHLLNNPAESTQRIAALPPFESVCGYFVWDSETAHVLKLLQEGLVYRNSLVPDFLRVAVAGVLKIRWEDGDSFDRFKVMQLSSLLPSQIFSKYLEEAFLCGSEKSQDEAFHQTAALSGEVPFGVKEAVLNRLANQILGSKESSDLLRVDALVARLPKVLGAEYVQQRCLTLLKLTRLLGPAGAIFSNNPRSKSKIGFRKIIKNAETWRTQGALMMGAVALVNVPMILSFANVGGGINAIGMALVSWLSGDKERFALKMESVEFADIIPFALSGVAVFLYMLFPILFRFRTEGEALGVRFFVRRVMNFGSLWRFGVTLLATVWATFAAWTAIYVFGLTIHGLVLAPLAANEDVPSMVLGFATVFFIFTVGMLLFNVVSFVQARKSYSRFRELTSRRGANFFDVILLAKDWKQLSHWLLLWDVRKDILVCEIESEQIRTLSAVLQLCQRDDYLPSGSPSALLGSTTSENISHCLSDIERIGEWKAQKA